MEERIEPANTSSGAATAQAAALFETRHLVDPPPGYVPLAIPELWDPEAMPGPEADGAAPASAPAPAAGVSPEPEPSAVPTYVAAPEPERTVHEIAAPEPAVVDAPPPGYVPLEMPESWEPPVEEAPVAASLGAEPAASAAERAPAAEDPAPRVERGDRDASRNQPGSGVRVAAEGDWVDPDAVQIRVLPGTTTRTGPVTQQIPPATQQPAASAPTPPQPTVVPSQHVAPQHSPPVTGAVMQTTPVQPQAAGARPATAPVRQRRWPRSLQELRGGPFEGREFETAQELAVAAVLELGHPIPAIARLFRVPAYRLEEWIRAAQPPQPPQPPRVPHLGTAGRPLDR